AIDDVVGAFRSHRAGFVNAARDFRAELLAQLGFEEPLDDEESAAAEEGGVRHSRAPLGQPRRANIVADPASAGPPPRQSNSSTVVTSSMMMCTPRSVARSE